MTVSPLELVDWKHESVIKNLRFFESLHSTRLSIGFILSKVATAILGITSRYKIQRRKWPFLSSFGFFLGVRNLFLKSTLEMSRFPLVCNGPDLQLEICLG